MRFPEIIGSGSFYPNLATNEQIIKVLKPKKPDGTMIAPGWLERHFGIETRGFDFDFEEGAKRSPERGGIYDNELAIRAAREALKDANISPHDIGSVIHVSATPDYAIFQNQFSEIISSLELPATAQYIHLNLGCAALATAFDVVHGELLRLKGKKHVLLIASQCTSALAHSQTTLERYANAPDQWAWLAPAVFSDAGSAMVFKLGEEGNKKGIIKTHSKVLAGHFLMQRKLGGSKYPITPENVELDTVTMNATLVNEKFNLVMQELYDQLKNDWPTDIEPIVGHSFDHSKIRFFFFHQANLRKIEGASALLEIPSEKTPINIKWLGNSSAPSTLQLVDDVRKKGQAKPGDIGLFLLVGGGNGAHYGYSVYVF